MKNDGRTFEDEISATLLQYRSSHIMKVEKVDPPSRIIGRRVIFTPNPFLDFVGVLTEYGSRMVMFEAKSTSNPYLPLLMDGGLRVKQWDAMRLWAAAGAVVFLLWQCGGAGQNSKLVTIEQIREALNQRKLGKRSARQLEWLKDGHYVPQARHMVHDFYRLIEKGIPLVL